MASGLKWRISKESLSSGEFDFQLVLLTPSGTVKYGEGSTWPPYRWAWPGAKSW